MPLTKYNFDFSREAIDVSVRRLTNQLWKLIPMREHEENWIGQLDTVIIELVGLNEILYKDELFLILLSKLEGLKAIEDLDFSSAEGCGEAIEKIKGAINHISSVRSRLGAYQNRLEHTEKNIDIQSAGASYIGSKIFEASHICKRFGDKVILVDAPFETRLERACRRDGADRPRIIARMQTQKLMNALSGGFEDSRIDCRILNDSTMEELERRTRNAINSLIS